MFISESVMLNIVPERLRELRLKNLRENQTKTRDAGVEAGVKKEDMRGEVKDPSPENLSKNTTEQKIVTTQMYTSKRNHRAKFIVLQNSTRIMIGTEMYPYPLAEVENLGISLHHRNIGR